MKQSCLISQSASIAMSSKVSWPISDLPDEPRRPWEEWGPEEQERNLRQAVGDEGFDWLERSVEHV